MKIFSLQSVARTATVAIVFALCANSAARHQYKILVDLNQIYREELPEAWRLKCDGVSASLHNSGTIPLQEWQVAFDLLGPGEVYTIDDYFNVISFNKAVEIVGLENVMMGCGYLEPTLTPEYLTETLTDAHIEERYAKQQGKKVLVLARGYQGYRRTEVQRALRNPKVGGVIWELDTVNTTSWTYYTEKNLPAGIRDILALGKKCFLLATNTTTVAAEDLFMWVSRNVPEALADPNFYFVPAAYCGPVRFFPFYGETDSVETAIDRLKELRGDRQIALLNSDFEKGMLAYWDTAQDNGVTWSIDSDTILSGNYSAKYDNTAPHRHTAQGQNADRGSISQTIHFDANQPFAASYYVAGRPGFTSTLKVEWLDASNGAMRTDVSTMAPADVWTFHEITGTSPAGTAKARLVIEVADANESSQGNIYVDDVWLAGRRDFSNGGFEDGAFPPWTTAQDGGVAWSINAVTVLDGHFSAQYDNTWWQQNVSNGSISQTIYFRANEPYAASYFANGRTGYTLTLRVEWLDASDSVITTDASTMASTDRWTLHEITGVSPVGAVKARFTIEVADSGEPSNGTIYFDDASLMPL